MPVTTFRGTLEELRGAQKPPRGVSLYSLRVNRPVGRYLAAGAHVLGLRPNHVTALSGVCSLTAVALLATVRPSLPLGLAVGLALVLGFALDSADGQLARLRPAAGRSGEWLDHMLDCLVKLVLHAAVLIGWYRFLHTHLLLLLPLGFQLVAVLLFFGGILVEKLRSPGLPRSAAGSGLLRSVLLLPVDNGTLCCAFLLWGAAGLFEVAYAVLFVAHLLYLLGFSRIWFRELR